MAIGTNKSPQLAALKKNTRGDTPKKGQTYFHHFTHAHLLTCAPAIPFQVISMSHLSSAEDNITRGRFSDLILAQWTTEKNKEVAVKVRLNLPISVTHIERLFTCFHEPAL